MREHEKATKVIRPYEGDMIAIGEADCDLLTCHLDYEEPGRFVPESDYQAMRDVCEAAEVFIGTLDAPPEILGKEDNHFAMHGLRAAVSRLAQTKEGE